MAITLTVTGNGHFRGAATNLVGYSVAEDATPIDVSDSSGGTGGISFTVSDDDEADGAVLLYGDTVELEDGSNGRTRGLVTSLSSSGGEVAISADSRLNMLVAERVAAPFVGNLHDAMWYYLGLVGITSGIVVDPAIAARAVVFPGWSGDLWTGMKALCAVQQVEISLVSSNIVVRPLRSRTVDTAKNSSVTWGVAQGSIAQSVEVYCYHNTYKGAAVAYPVSEYEALTAPVFQVDAGQVVVQTVTLAANMFSISQPSAALSVPPYYQSGASIYAVLDKDGITVAPADWYAGGGFVNAVLLAGSDTVELTIRGSRNADRAPYRLASAFGGGVELPSLRLAGEGIFFDKELITIPTGAPSSLTAQVVGVTIDSPFISTLTEAYTVGMLAAGRWAGTEQTISVNATVVNRKGEAGSTRYPTFAEFATTWAGKTFAQFDTAQGSNTFDDYATTAFAAVADTFENQAFGNIIGARVPFKAANYRIRSSTVAHDTISYSAERDTLFSDFNSLWSGSTFAAFDAKFTGKTFSDFGVIPLWQ